MPKRTRVAARATAGPVLALEVTLWKTAAKLPGSLNASDYKHVVLALYNAVRQNDSAVLEFGDEVFQAIARERVQVVKRSATVDGDKKEQVHANLRRNVRRLLARHHYPSNRQEAVVLAMPRAELITGEEGGVWAA